MIRYSTVRNLAALTLILFLLVMLAGCAGLQTNSSVTTELSVNAGAAAALLPQAQGGTLSASDCLSAIVSVGSTVQDLHGQLTLSGGSYLFGGKGLWVTDPNYYSPLCEIMANALASRDLAIGRWATNAPPAAFLNTVSAQSLKALVVIQGMQQDKTATTVSLTKPKVVRAMAKLTTAQTSLLDIIESKLPAAFKTWYNSLPAATQALVNNDLALVVGWGESQLQAWWNAYEGGDTVQARELALSTQPDDQVLTTFTGANSAGVSAIQTHVAGEVAFINGAKDFALAILPAILAIFGL
jgi:hypothetical protein